MALQKQYSILSTIFQISKSVLQFGNGSELKDNSGTSQALASDGTTLIEVQGADPTAGSSFATRDYVDGVASPYAASTYVLSGTTSTVTGVNNIPANAVISQVLVTISTAYVGTAPTLSVGIAGNTSLFVASADVDLTRAGNTQSFVSAPGISIGGSAAPLVVTIGGTGLSAGAFAVTALYSNPNS
jgi:hypothetical protein